MIYSNGLRMLLGEGHACGVLVTTYELRRGTYVYGEGRSPYPISYVGPTEVHTVSQTYEKRTVHALMASQPGHAGARSE